MSHFNGLGRSNGVVPKQSKSSPIGGLPKNSFPLFDREKEIIRGITLKIISNSKVN